MLSVRPFALQAYRGEPLSRTHPFLFLYAFLGVSNLDRQRRRSIVLHYKVDEALHRGALARP